ncbi:MAG: oligoendopeptidase F [Candidatus Aminicenantes bacterium]|nr:oligoendopeptidase F [Candidatus Aminicenantes bacterium]
MSVIKKIFIVLVFAGLILPSSGFSSSKNIPDFSTTERDKVPEEFKWNISDIFPSIEAWKKGSEELGKLIPQLTEVSKDWTMSAGNMLKFFKTLGKIYRKGYKLYSYASNRSNMDMGNPLFQKMKGEMRSYFIRIGSMISFVNSDILKLGGEKFAEYIKAEPELKVYKFEIDEILRMKAHVLPPDQQRIVSLTGLFSSAPSRTSGILNNVEMPNAKIKLADGKEVELNYSNYAKYRKSKNPDRRSRVMRKYWGNHRMFEKTFAVLLDAEMKKHVFNSKVGKFENTLKARLYPNSIDTSVYHNLIKYTRENLEPLHRYLKLKKDLLKLKEYKYDDIYASAVAKVDKLYTFEEAKDLIIKVMKPLGADYEKGLKKAFDERWIDIYANKGKQSGAYSSGLYDVHPFVKMNYDGSYSDLSTLAHELGHAMHSWFTSKKQHFTNSNYATFLAEIASTFNESLLINYLLENEKDDLFKLFLLDEYIEGFRVTLYRQTLFAEFELALHKMAEQGKTLTADILDQKYLELTRYYYGHDKGVVKVDDFIRNEWAGIPHFFLNYYVYTYSTGIIASMALADNVLHGENKKQNKAKYLDFISAGGSRPPLDILKTAGVDMTTADPFQKAFKRLNYLVTEMEKIVKRLKKKNKI